ncbi:hypothetical protein BKA62DRAFT_698498 [Auriculariales sp. MPI-PUGE-AT-0066]|nr:hypothetical protein BKA62DRAFT_698498 [Auriculariales sp. MPI-PUGE-AT-0066]
MLASQMVEVLPLLAQRQNALSTNRVGDPGQAVLNLWLFFNIGPSHFLLPLLCISLLLARVRRNLLLVNVCITWCICGFASCMLLYAGKQTGPEPSTFLCIAQGSLLYAIPPLCSTAVCALVFSVWSNICWKRGERTRGFYLSILVISPYVVYFTFAAIGALLAAKEPFRVSRTRRFFYCSIDHSGFSAALAIYSAIILLLTMVFNILIGITIWHNNRLLKEATRLPPQTTVTKNGLDKKGLKPEDVQFAIRLGIFGVYIVLGITLSLLSIAAPTSAVPDMVFASMGLAVFLVFGSQPKVWEVWRDLFRRKPREEDQHIPTLTPFHLDPLPGQEQQYDPELGALPPPVPEKVWRSPPASATLQMLQQSPGVASALAYSYGSPQVQPQPLMSEKRALAVRFQESVTVHRPPSTATIPDHPYRTANQDSVPSPRVVAPTSPVDRAQVVQMRGKQPRTSPFGTPIPGKVFIQPDGGQAISSYETQGSATVAAQSYDNASRFLAPGSYESQGNLGMIGAAAGSYQSQYLTPAFVGMDADLPALHSPGASQASRDMPSDLATYNSSAEIGEDDGERSFGSSSGASLEQRLLARVQRTDPIMPRF